MLSEHRLWSEWAQFLNKGGIKPLASFLLEAGGPLTTALAQVCYLGQPFVSQDRAVMHLQALVEMLENKEETHSFAAFLREEDLQ
jgi:hypothetical protein